MRNHAWLTVAALTVLMITAFCIHPVWAQQVASGIGLGFNAQLETYPPPNETQIKTSLEGDKAEPAKGGQIFLTGAKLKSFATNGALEFEARTPKCVFDTVQRTVSSTNILQLEMTNGGFYTEGTGFLLLTNGNLFLSNRVHTIIRNPQRNSSQP